MAAKGGQEHHFAKRQRENKQDVLRLVAAGMDVKSAIRSVGRGEDVLKRWLEDAAFASDLEAAYTVARLDAEKLAGSGGKYAVDFATFSKEFLGMEVFPHQQNWIDVLEGNEPSWLHPSMKYEPGNPKRLLINVPPEHAKSTTITVGYATYLICMNPNIKIAIVSKTQTRAAEFLYAIKQRLTEERWTKLQQAYAPDGGFKETADQWTQTRIYLKRDSDAKDPTVQALGIGQQIYGTRADVIIVDDAVDTENAHEFEKQMNWLQKMVTTRVGKMGRIIIVGTRVSPIDFYKEIRNPDRWTNEKSPYTWFAMPAVLEFDTNPEKWVTLWPVSDRPWEGEEDDAVPDENGHYSKWDGPTLYTRRGEVSSSTWAMVYQQQDVEDDAIFNPILVSGATNRMRKPGPIKFGTPGHPTEGNWVTLIGFDPAMTGKAGFVAYAVDRNTGKRLILDVFNMSDPSPQKIRSLIEEWVEKYRPYELIVEINAHQKSYALDTELNQWLAGYGVKLKPHFTGKNKWDTNFGVASMSALLGTLRDGKAQKDNLMELPNNANEHVKALTLQMITWKPDTKNPTDVLMALWFCELRAKELVRFGKNRQTHVQNRWATRKNVEQQYSVSLNEMATTNYYA